MPVRRLLVVAIVAASMILTGCTDDEPEPTPTPAPELPRLPYAIATNPGPFDAGPVDPPKSGALLGAWAKPDPISQSGRIEAIHDLEETLGRRLDIINTYRKWEEDFASRSDREFVSRGRILMLSWAADDMRSITDGTHDDLIRSQARKVKAIRKPVLIRFRWEMDRPNLRPTVWSPKAYVAAWHHVRRIFVQERTRNASWVWCPTSEGFISGDAASFYPGDDTVDWTCVDVYAGADFRPIAELMGPFLTWAARRPKPIMVGEFGVARAWGPTRRADWLRDAARLFKANPQVKAVVYFESDPDGNGAQQQFRLSDDLPALSAFGELTRDPYFNRHR